MIIKIISRLLKIDQNDREIADIQQRAQKQIQEATLTIKKAGKMQDTLVRKTTTFYIGRATGAIR